MAKFPSISVFFRASSLASGLVLGLSAGVWAASSPPPPPFVNPDALPPAPATGSDGLPAAPDGAGASVAALPTPAPSPGVDMGAMFDSSVAAPSISDDQQIKNSMDMAMELFHAEDYDACAKATDALLARFPKKKLYWVRYLEGLSLEHQDLYPQALDCYQRVVKDAPHTTYANAASFRIGLCQQKAGDPDEAVYTLRDIIENNPHSEYRLQAYIHLGNLYRNTKDWGAAERVYKDLIRFYPNSTWSTTSMMYMAEIKAHRGDDDGAIRVYQTLLDNPKVPDIMRAQAILSIGDLYISDERWLEALQTYRYALRDFSDVPGVISTCNEKIPIATEGRKFGRVPYRDVNTGPHIVDQPADENYLLKQETVPDQ
ncbi:MAG TPA: tetratricopeptide repeat protein [bacterium]|nr:tetratricopeptide repeat protein [bacterium]